MSKPLLGEFAETAESAARKAGKLLLEWSGKLGVRHKGVADLVTEADVAAQRVIRETLLTRFPDHGFLGEEGDRSGETAEFQWVVDPLDGTTNYVHGYPFYAVSIGLKRGNQLMAGVVYHPAQDECFSAAAGLGAWLGATRLRTSPTAEVADALLVTSFPPAIRRDDPQVQHFIRVLEQGQSVRRTGSAALNLAYVAAGRFDAFWATRMHPWDVAAGVLLVQEAGGRCSDFTGRPYDIDQPNLLSSNGTALHEQLRGLLA